MEEEQNAYAQYGTLAHAILEEWACGNLPAEKMAEEWERRHDIEVSAPYPPYPKGYREKAYKQGLDYFKNFSGFGDDKEVISTEKQYFTTIGGCKFRGIIDLVLHDKNTKVLSILDHKSKSLASYNKDRTIMRQLYCYAKLIYEKSGEYPNELLFNLFKEGGVIIEEPFNMKSYEEALRWVEMNIACISMETKWEPVYQKMFCQNLCGVRKYCQRALSE